MKSIDGGFEKKGIHEGDEGLYGKSSYADEHIELESADDFKGALDALELTDDTPELFSANDFGRAGFGDKHFVSKTERADSTKEESKALTPDEKKRFDELKLKEDKSQAEWAEYFKLNNKDMMSKLDDLFK